MPDNFDNRWNPVYIFTIDNSKVRLQQIPL